MIRHAVVSVEEVLPLIEPYKIKSKKKFHPFSGIEVKINRSVRLQCFAQLGTVCSRCGLMGEFFAIESISEERPHLNLYGVRDGEQILITRDHIRPMSKGGKDSIGNSQTMCAYCNRDKADKLEE
jgi:5-methylcytosine-specific restriction endonuclease McrA